jgi:Flp pilus assembly pilin Flp
LEDQTLQPALPRAATHEVAMTGGRKLRPARWTSLYRDLQAVVALEYALIAGVMVFVVFTVSGPFATALSSMFTNVANQL